MERSIKNLALERLGPCGVHCGRCFAYAKGDISTLSNELKKALGDFDVYARRFAEILDEPVFLKYQDFKEFLSYLANVECKGCRQENCKLFKNCNVRACSENKQVDFCFECGEFPCQKTGFDEHLYKRHVGINERMKEIGIENYYLEVKDQPRY